MTYLHPSIHDDVKSEAVVIGIVILYVTINKIADGNAEFPGVDNAGVDKSARCGKGEQCRSSEIGIMGNLNSQIKYIPE